MGDRVSKVASAAAAMVIVIGLPSLSLSLLVNKIWSSAVAPPPNLAGRAGTTVTHARNGEVEPNRRFLGVRGKNVIIG